MVGGSLLAVAEVGGTQAQGTVCVCVGGGQLLRWGVPRHRVLCV